MADSKAMSDTKFPCPFAHTEDDGEPVCAVVKPSDGGFYVECDFCLARGPQMDTEAEAIAAWNERALTPKQKAAEEMYEALKAWERMVVELYPAGCSAPEHKDEFRAVYRLYRQTQDALAKAGQP